MARKLTPERQKLRLDAIRLRQELGWSNRRIAAHLTVPETTIRRWIRHNYKARVRQNTAPLSPNNIYCMDCLTENLQMQVFLYCLKASLTLSMVAQFQSVGTGLMFRCENWGIFMLQP